MMALLFGVLGMQVIAAVAAWWAAPWAIAAWSVLAIWVFVWISLLRSAQWTAVVGGRGRRALALLLALIPLLVSSAWCLGGWWGWWRELDAAAVVMQGLLLPFAPALDLVPAAATQVAPYLWVSTALPWALVLTIILIPPRRA